MWRFPTHGEGRKAHLSTHTREANGSTATESIEVHVLTLDRNNAFSPPQQSD